MKYLITGGSGYLGSYLATKLVNKGHSVFNIDINQSDNESIKNYYFNILNESELDNFFNKNAIDVVVHNASAVPITKDNFNNINIRSTKLILENFVKYKIKKLVYISTSAVYGTPNDFPITENSQRIPIEDYGRSKKISEDECLKKMSENNITIIRPRTIIGGNRMGIFSLLFDWIENNIPLPVLNNGENLYQFVDINDLTEAIYLSSKIDYSGDLNIGSSKFMTIRHLLTSLVLEVGSKSKLKNLDNSLLFNIAYLMQKMKIIPLQDYHFKMYGENVYFDTNKAEKILNWKSTTSNLTSLINSYKIFQDKNRTFNNSPHQKKMISKILKYAPFLI